jgi:fermentation-respiration switch protein FrsA (DUF1100 family)
LLDPSNVPFVLKMLLVLGLGYAALVGFVYFTQGSLIYFPNVAREHTATPAAYGLPYEDAAIKTEDGETLHAWWVPAEKARGAVLLFHGNAGNISHRIEYARMFRMLGYSTLLVDYRGYGKSTGSPSEEGTYRDAAASWQWLATEQRLKGSEIVVFGESLGGAVACWLGARERPRALVLASTFTSVPDLGAEVYRFLPVRLLSRFKYDTRDCLSRVEAPVLIAHSPRDDIVPHAHGKRLYEAAREPKHFLELAGGHNEGLLFTRREWVEALGAFLEKVESKSM